jgi:hypothetical protein
LDRALAMNSLRSVLGGVPPRRASRIMLVAFVGAVADGAEVSSASA